MILLIAGMTMLIAGVLLFPASAGIVTGVVPDLSSRIPRLLLFLCFGPGGFVLLMQMYFDKGKLRAWDKNLNIARK